MGTLHPEWRLTYGLDDIIGEMCGKYHLSSS